MMQTEPESPAPRQRAAWRARAALATSLVVAVVGAAAVMWPDEPVRELRADGVVAEAPAAEPPGSTGGQEHEPVVTSGPGRTPPKPGSTRPNPPATLPRTGGTPSTIPNPGTVTPTTAPATTTTDPRPGPGGPATTSTTVPPTTVTTSAPAGGTSTRPRKFTDLVAFVDRDRGGADHHLAVLDLRNGEPRRLTKMDGTVFSWAPDGVRIALPLSGAIHVLDTGSGDIQILPGSRGTETQPVWSPDGEWIAYLDGSPNQDNGLWLMHPDGSERHRISGGIQGAPAWSPDGALIAFGALTGSAAAELHLLTVDGTALRNLTAGPGGGSSPVFAPDGSRLAFTADDNTLAVADVATTEIRRYPAVGRAINPSWAHNGRQVLVEHFDGQVSSIRSVDLADGSARQLTSAGRPAVYQRPQWVPDGSAIIYAGDCGETTDNLCRLDPSGKVSLLVDSAGVHFAFQPRP